MLYHSFPRPRDDNPYGKGLKILENILRHGFLLVPEVKRYPGKTDAEGNESGGFSLVQCRFCMTAIDHAERFEEHQKDFGDIHLEFTDKSAYELGAIPVMYIPKAHAQEAPPSSLWHLAFSFIHRLSDFAAIISMLEYMDKAAAEFAGEKEITVNSAAGITKEIDVSQLRDILELIMEGTVDIHGDTKTKELDFRQMQGAVQGLCSLFYFTDMDYGGEYKPLHYFRQQEWRIVQGISISGKTLDRKLSDEEQEATLSVDKAFFSKEPNFDDNTGRKNTEVRIIDMCRMLTAVNGTPVQSFINRVYVKSELHGEAVKIAKKSKFPAEKIVSYNEIGDILKNAKGVTHRKKQSFKE